MSRRLRTLLLLVSAGILLLAVVDGALWIFHRLDLEPDPISVDYAQDLPGVNPQVHLEKNHLELRTSSVNSRKKSDENTVRIICLGTSTTEQLAQNFEDSWVGQLERKLNETYAGEAMRIELAAHADSDGKMHEVLRWSRRNLLDLDPDAVITLFGLNSLISDGALAQAGSFEDWRKWIEAEPGSVRAGLRRYSQIYRHARSFRRRGKASPKNQLRLRLDADTLEKLRRRYWLTPVEPGIAKRPGRTDLFRSKTEYFMKWLEENGVRQVVLAQPLLLHDHMDYAVGGGGRVELTNLRVLSDLWEVEQVKQELKSIWMLVNTGAAGLKRLTPGSFREELSRFHGVQKELARAHGVAYVPLDEVIAPELDNFFDDCHFTDAGSSKVAEAVFPVVRDLVRTIIDERR